MTVESHSRGITATACMFLVTAVIIAVTAMFRYCCVSLSLDANVASFGCTYYWKIEAYNNNGKRFVLLVRIQHKKLGYR